MNGNILSAFGNILTFIPCADAAATPKYHPLAILSLRGRGGDDQKDIQDERLRCNFWLDLESLLH